MRNYRYEDRLETERLITRKLVYEDYKLWAPFFDDPEAIRFFPFLKPTSSEERAIDWIQKQLDRYREQRYGLQALIDKKTGEFIGQCGLLLQDIHGTLELEVGYSILMKYWGKGYATEAAIRFKEYGFAHEQADSIISIIDINNIGSQKVALKNGMSRDYQTVWHDMNVYIFRARE